VCGSPAWQALGAQPCRVNIVPCHAGFGGVAGKAEIVQGWGAPPSKMELLQGCASLGSMAGKEEIMQGWGEQPSEMELLQAFAGLGSLAGKAEIMQGWGPQPSMTEFLQGCAGLGGVWPGRDCRCLGIPGLKGSSNRDPVGLRGGNLGYLSPGGAKEQGWRIRLHGVWSSCSLGLWGGAWCATPAILLVYDGVERPPTS
jgi:hypothetical protein